MKLLRIYFIIVIMGCLVSDIGAGEQPEEISPGDIGNETFISGANYPLTERAVNLLTANPTRKKSFLIIIDHRNRAPADEEPLHDFFGFDSGGLKIGIGVRYGLFNDLDFGIYRSNGTTEVFDTYEVDLRYRYIDQERYFVNLAIRPGATLFSHKNQEDASGCFCQLLMSRSLKNRLTLGTGILYHSESSNEEKSHIADDYSMAAQALVEFNLFRFLSAAIEGSFNIGGYGSDHPQMSAALKFYSYRHTFALVATNTQYTTADGVVSNSSTGIEDFLRIGFSITREISID